MRIGETWIKKSESSGYYSPIEIVGFDDTERGEEVLFLPLDEDKRTAILGSVGRNTCHFPRFGFLEVYKKVYE